MMFLLAFFHAPHYNGKASAVFPISVTRLLQKTRQVLKTCRVCMFHRGHFWLRFFPLQSSQQLLGLFHTDSVIL